jgi:hypothetical protein
MAVTFLAQRVGACIRRRRRFTAREFRVGHVLYGVMTAMVVASALAGRRVRRQRIA